jgi:hypothetical protein
MIKTKDLAGEMISESMRAELHWMEQEYIHYISKKKTNGLHTRRKKVERR